MGICCHCHCQWLLMLSLVAPSWVAPCNLGVYDWTGFNLAKLCGHLNGQQLELTFLLCVFVCVHIFYSNGWSFYALRKQKVRKTVLLLPKLHRAYTITKLPSSLHLLLVIYLFYFSLMLHFPMWKNFSCYNFQLPQNVVCSPACRNFVANSTNSITRLYVRKLLVVPLCVWGFLYSKYPEVLRSLYYMNI